MYIVTISRCLVLIGLKPCVVKNISSSQINCYLKRTGGQNVALETLSVLVAGRGYAASSSQYSTRPTVTSGYEVGFIGIGFIASLTRSCDVCAHRYPLCPRLTAACTVARISLYSGLDSAIRTLPLPR